jgi:hypothetical protein
VVHARAVNADPRKWSNPAFSLYDPALARAMTEFLYKDPWYPYHGDESKWSTFGVIHTVWRKLDVTALGVNADVQRLALMGGRNTIVISKMATVVNNTYAAEALDGRYCGYVTYEQKRADGFIEVEQQPVANTWGCTPGWPAIPPIPEFWVGNNDRVVTTTNLAAAVPVTLDITYGWLCAVLDTGA